MLVLREKLQQYIVTHYFLTQHVCRVRCVCSRYYLFVELCCIFLYDELCFICVLNCVLFVCWIVFYFLVLSCIFLYFLVFSRIFLYFFVSCVGAEKNNTEIHCDTTCLCRGRSACPWRYLFVEIVLYFFVSSCINKYNTPCWVTIYQHTISVISPSSL